MTVVKTSNLTKKFGKFTAPGRFMERESAGGAH